MFVHCLFLIFLCGVLCTIMLYTGISHMYLFQPSLLYQFVSIVGEEWACIGQEGHAYQTVPYQVAHLLLIFLHVHIHMNIHIIVQVSIYMYVQNLCPNISGSPD